jgi:methionyl-tRNA formyltransferase
MRILFLGNNYNPISIACLLALIAAGHYMLMIGFSNLIEEGKITTLRRLMQRYGVRGLVSRGNIFLTAMVRRRLRRMGFKSQHYGSLREVLDIHSVPEMSCGNINAPQTLENIRAFNPGLIVSVSFGQILGKEVLQLPANGALNVHPSLLPKYRGPSPCYWAIRRREQTSGVTVHRMNERIDAGDIVAQREIPIRRGETEHSLQRRLSPIGAELLLAAIGEIERGSLHAVRQDENLATYFSFPKSRRRGFRDSPAKAWKYH